MISTRVSTCLTLTALVFSPQSVWSSEEPVELPDTIVVTANRTPSTYSELSRSVTVIGPEEIELAPTRNLIDLLVYIPGVELRRQSTNAVRSDIGLRGGTFQQALVLIDGVKVTDPQTGHHNLDLPFDLSEVERIEIVRGSGSKLYGPNAMAGVVNVITRRPTDRRLAFESVLGDHGLAEQRLSVSTVTGPVGHRIGLERRLSSGFMNNTEFDLSSFSYRSSLQTGSGSVDLTAGYTEREFGAYRLYSDAYPNEWEATSTLFADVTSRTVIGSTILTPRVFWRRHKDDFVLDRNRPDWSRNQNTTDRYGVELQTTHSNRVGELVLGGELAQFEIESSNLANESRARGGIFAEQRLTFGNRLSVVPGLSLYWHEDDGWKGWPGLDVGYQISSPARLYATINRSYRVPDMTELYYLSAANRGDPDLKPERATSYEVGWRFSTPEIETSLALFARHGSDLIDWALMDPTSAVWQVLNVIEVTTRGIESGVDWRQPYVSSVLECTRLGAHYSYLDSQHAGQAYDYKYLMTHPRHQIRSGTCTG
jgi:iron complex outermembrane receptor protein